LAVVFHSRIAVMGCRLAATPLGLRRFLMKEVFSSEFFVRVIIEVLLLGVVVFFIQRYFENKWAPLTAAETLKKENFLNAKRDTYFEAISILNRALINDSFIENGKVSDNLNRNPGSEYPNDLEINSCFSKLCIYSDDKEVLDLYRKLFLARDSTSRPILDMRNFIIHLRQDLGYGDIKIDPTKDEYQLIITHRKK